jgi:hypothetical protein
MMMIKMHNIAVAIVPPLLPSCQMRADEARPEGVPEGGDLPIKRSYPHQAGRESDAAN